MRRPVLVLALAAAAAAAPATARAASTTVTGGGERILELTASAPTADWAVPGRESAVVSVEVDGQRTADAVLFDGARPFTYRVALGQLAPGPHRVRVVPSSAVASQSARVWRLRARRPTRRDALAARFAPILYGRDVPEVPGAYENATTDVPLLTYHTASRDGAGRTVLEYSVVWSNEDGGTNTPQLMSRWGRSTDIEWIYRVTLDAAGEPVDEVFQSANHGTDPFTGAKAGRHPILRTATANNNLEQVEDPAAVADLRFAGDFTPTLAPGRARESLMDANPWSYRIAAAEMAREGKVEQPADPATPAMSDQRNYLFAEVLKATTAAAAPSGSWIGTALDVKLRGDDTWYLGDHGDPPSSIQRDDPAATTVELPAGTRPGDVEAIRARAVPVGEAAPADWSVDVRRLTRAFMLRDDHEPGLSFARWSGSRTLTPAAPEAVIWTRR